MSDNPKKDVGIAARARMFRRVFSVTYNAAFPYSYLQMDLEKFRNSLDIGTAPGIERLSAKHQALVQSGFNITKRFALDRGYRHVTALPGQVVKSHSTADTVFGWRLSQIFRLTKLTA